MANLRDEILKLTNPAPVFKDPEDNSEDETSAKVVDRVIDGYEEIAQPSKLRQKTAIILADSDRRYAGKKTSRKNFDDSGEESEGIDESGSDDSSDDDQNALLIDEGDEDIDDDDDNDDDDDENVTDVGGGVDKDFNKKFSKFGTKEFVFKDDGDFAKYADDDDDDDDDSGDDSDDQQDENDGSDDDDGSEDEDSGKGDEDLSDDDDDENDDMGDEEIDSEDEGIQKFSSAATDEIAKGQAAKQQLGLWDTLLEGRIKLQKAVSIVNQLPHKDTWTDFSETSDSFAEEAGKAQQALGHLLGSLVHLQDLLLHQNTETRNILEGKPANKKKKAVPADDDDDEEITSDSDVEMDKPDNKPTYTTSVRKRKLKLDDYPDVLKKRHCSFQEYRNATIQKWYDKTRLAAGKVKGKSFSAFDQSAVVQINQILADKERLIKRTQLKRTVYRVLGTKPTPDQPEILPSQQDEERVSDRDNHKDNNVEIFDDDDFYHQLLRELIEKKTSDVSDPVALSRQWLMIQKLRSKNKKKVDNRASKGRKVRYDVHKKLVNFMAPVDNCKWSHEARDDLFKSLFGKRFSTNQV